MMLTESKNQSNIAPQFGNRRQTFTVLGGEGLNIFTKEYGTLFDAVAGYWYNVLGMRDPELLQVKQEIGGIATHLYDEYTNPFAEKLATSLCERTSMSKLVFSATGSMANENARKEAVNYHKSKGKKESELVFATIKGSYHGSIGEMLKWIDPQKNPYSIDAPIYEKKDQIQEIIDIFSEKIKLAKSNGKTIAGFFFEPIMGVRGSVPLPLDYINGIGEICEKNDILLIADEVTTGIGRAGKFVYSNSFKIKPDMICFGKAISAGHYPVAITLFNQKIIDGWNKLEETLEYSQIHRRGNSIAGTQEGCALGLKVLEILDRDNLIQEVLNKGKYALEKLKIIESHPAVIEIRGTGLLIGIDMINSKFAKEIVTPKMRQHGINIFPEGRVVMFNPAYIVTKVQIDNFVDKLNYILQSSKL